MILLERLVGRLVDWLQHMVASASHYAYRIAKLEELAAAWGWQLSCTFVPHGPDGVDGEPRLGPHLRQNVRRFTLKIEDGQDNWYVALIHSMLMLGAR